MTITDSQCRSPLCHWGFGLIRNLIAAAGTLVFVAVAALSRDFWLRPGTMTVQVQR